jgi:dTDP-glucose 4,6-dehydratase
VASLTPQGLSEFRGAESQARNQYRGLITDIGDEIIKLTGTKQKMIFKTLPTDDPKQRRPDITKAKEILGWEPKVGRAEGLKITYDYFRSLPDQEIQHKDFTYYNNK